MKEKTKKWLVTAGLAAVSAGLVFGISSVLYREPVQKPVIGTEDTGDASEIIIDIGKMQTVQTGEKGTEMATDMEENRADTEERDSETEETLVTEFDKNTRVTVSGKEQEIQPEPKKTEKEKPDEPPASSGNGDTGKTGIQPADGTPEEPVTQPAVETPKEPATQPVTELPKEPVPQPADENQNSRTGDIKDGMMYVEGFGWVPYEGGGGQGIYAADMYENGNKIGIMD